MLDDKHVSSVLDFCSFAKLKFENCAKVELFSNLTSLGTELSKRSYEQNHRKFSLRWRLYYANAVYDIFVNI